jgi:hypothetical protein
MGDSPIEKRPGGMSGLLYTSLYTNAQHALESRFAECLVHPVGGSTAHARYPVRVAVEGHCYRGVPQKMLYEFRVDAAPQKEGGAHVPEIVPTNRVETFSLEERLEVAVHYVLSV